MLEGVKDLAKGLCEEQKEITHDLMPSHAFFCHLDFLYSLIPLSSYQHLVVRPWPREQECTSFTPPFAKIYPWFCEEDSKKYVFLYYQSNSKWSIQMIHINLQNSLIQFYMFSQKIKKLHLALLLCHAGVVNVQEQTCMKSVGMKYSQNFSGYRFFFKKYQSGFLNRNKRQD